MSNDNNRNGNKIRRKQVSSSANKTSPSTRASSTNKTSSTSSTNTRRKSRSIKKKKDKFKFFRVSGIILLVLLVVGAAAGTGLVFASLRNTEPVTKALLDERTHQTTKIYYANKTLLSNAPSINKKEPVELDQISSHLKNAVISIEDERFYEHNGVDITGLVRSVVRTLTGTKQGGSTIPMQVSKMLLTSKEQTLPRKIKDIYYAYEMSKTVSKDDILEAYLNNFFVGRGLVGAEAGARGYFDKSAADLTLAEAALLAGSTKNPSRYSAYTPAKLDGTETKEDLENKLIFYTNTTDDSLDDPTELDFNMIDKMYNDWKIITDTNTYKQLKSGTMVVRKAINNPDAKKRQEVVLMKMLELGYITKEEHDKAVAEEIKIKLPKSDDKVSSSVEDLIESDVINALMGQGHTWDEADNMFRNGGLIINTTIDPTIQDTLETEYKNNNNFPDNKVGPDGILQPQSAMVILDYRNGQIKGLVGGRHITGRKTLNRATYPQQPGSTIKPLSIYTPAIDTLKITQADVVSDTRGPYKFKENTVWNPKTTTSGKGSMSLRKALAYSSNTIAVKTAEMLGDTYEESIDIMIDYLKNFGITTVKDNKSGNEKYSDRSFSALTLGGMTTGISPLEMASAYGTLANGGVYVEPTIFTTITSYDDQLIVKNTPAENKVLASEVAYVITDMLSAVVTEGIGGSASIGSMPVAGKTGTTNNGLDAWFVGYTPYYVGATYIGDDAGKKDPTTGKTIERRAVKGSSTTAAKLWSKIMTKVHKNLTVTKFKVPSDVYFTRINLIDGGRSSSGSNAAFIKGTAPSRASSQPVVQEPEEPEENDNEETTPDNENNTTTPPTTPDNGGGTEQPDSSGGGATTPTPPAQGGGTTTPDNGGGGTTPTPPATTPTPPAQ